MLYFVPVQLLIEAESEDTVGDVTLGLLTEKMRKHTLNSSLLDWQLAEGVDIFPTDGSEFYEYSRGNLE